MAELSDRELDALARALSGRLQAVVPEGASPGVGVADVWCRLDALANQAGSFKDNLAMASESSLSHLQEEIVRDLKEV